MRISTVRLSRVNSMWAVMFVFLIQTDEMFTILMPWSERLSRFLTAHQHRLGQTDGAIHVGSRWKTCHDALIQSTGNRWTSVASRPSNIRADNHGSRVSGSLRNPLTSVCLSVWCSCQTFYKNTRTWTFWQKKQGVTVRTVRYVILPYVDLIIGLWRK